jgi:hypothetical protein
MPRSTVSEPAGQQAGDPGDRPGDRPVARALRAERAVRSVPVVPVRDLRVPAAAGAIGSTISGHSAQMLLAGKAGSAHTGWTRRGRRPSLARDRVGHAHSFHWPRPSRRSLRRIRSWPPRFLSSTLWRSCARPLGSRDCAIGHPRRGPRASARRSCGPGRGPAAGACRGTSGRSRLAPLSWARMERWGSSGDGRGQLTCGAAPGWWSSPALWRAMISPISLCACSAPRSSRALMCGTRQAGHGTDPACHGRPGHCV